ncbi:MAG TPA: SRPBCC domain-containing protein [Rhizomicrobium sp.]|nr:SRPBCC domain-containing protein [Rhizomicrobium sp.]
MTTDLKNELTIVRILNAPRDKVWQACSEPGALSQWWGQPTAATMPTCKVDFRIGGSLLCEIEPPDGKRLWFKWTYREIVAGEKLVLEQHSSDESGRDFDSPDRPASTVTLRLEDMSGKTKLTVVHAGMASEVYTVEMFTAGWSQSLDRLVDSLAGA